MDYLAVLREAASITWRFKFLWLFGFFVALTSGGSGGGWNFYNFSNFTTDTSDHQFRQGVSQVLNFISIHWGIIIILGIFIILFWFLLLFLSLTSQAAIISSIGKIENKQETNLKESFRRGIHYFWRVLGLFILIGLPFFILSLFIVIPLILWLVSGNLSFLPLFVGILFLSILLIILLAFFIGFISRYALRLIVLKDEKVIASLSSGFQLFFAKWKESLIIWLLLLAIGIGVGIILFLAALFLFIPAIAFVILAFATKKMLLLIPGLGLALIAILLLLILQGIYQVFYSNTWTLTFLNLTKPEEVHQS